MSDQEYTAFGIPISERQWNTQAIQKWCEETFGKANLIRGCHRAEEEMEEFIAELYCDDHTKESIGEEAADVVICLMHAIPDLWEHIDKKMNKNVQRNWMLRGDGTGDHVK